MKKTNLFDLIWISESRSFLMGWAIISVMVLHCCGWAHISLVSYPLHIVDIICSPVFTGVFMFVSGYGLYFSLYKNSNVKEFYKRRFTRLVLPFLIMATPFYSYYWLLGNMSFGEFLLSETTLYNFVVSNNGMWYIGASLIMYILSPYIYRIMGSSIKRAVICGVIMTALFVSLSLSIHMFLPDYSTRTSILWDKLAIFIVGMIFGYLTLRTKLMGGIIWLIIISLFVVLAMSRNKSEFVEIYYPQAKELLSILVISTLFHYTRRMKFISVFQIVLSWFGKYSLELYVFHMFLISMIKIIMYDYLNCPKDILHDRYAVFIMIFIAISACQPLHVLTTNVSNKFIKTLNS